MEKTTGKAVHKATDKAIDKKTAVKAVKKAVEKQGVRQYRRSWVYTLGVTLYRGLFYGLFAGRAGGSQHIPVQGAAILISNHTSALDPLTLALCVPRRQISFMAKKEIFHSRFVAGLLREIHAFPVNRGQADISAMREALTVLRSGELLGIFPEGHRGDGQVLGQLHSGAGLLALRSDAPVVPAFIKGAYGLFRGPQVLVGPALDIEDLRQRGSDKENAEEFSRRLLAALRQISEQLTQ